MRKKKITRKHFATLGIYCGLILLCLVALIPVAWMVVSSIKPSAEIFTSPPRWLPEKATLEHYANVIARRDIRLFLKNSIIVAGCTTLLSLCVAIPAGYGFARFQFPGRESLSLAILFSQMLPVSVVILPLFLVFDKLRILDTHLGLIIAYMVLILPLTVWMLRGFLQSIPRELEEAAMIDGCNRFTALIRVILPVSLPAIVATAIYAFIVAWNEFLIALILTSSSATRTLPIGISRFMGEYRVDWGSLMSVSVLATLPVVVLFLLLHRHFIYGLAQGAVKG